MRTTHERLVRHFTEQRDLPVAGSGVEAVMEQGRRQNRNRMIAVTVGALALVAVLGVGASALQRFLENGEGDLVADGAGESTATASGGEASWTAFETGIAWSHASLAGSDALYLLSTAPRAMGGGDPANPEQAIYTSSDGETWDVTVLGGEMWVNDLTQRDGVLYAIGTTPGTGGAAEVVVGTRQDGDEGWATVPLPTDFAGIDGLADSGASRTVSIAGDDTLVAAVSTTVWADFNALLPDDVVAGNRSAQLTPEGVVVIDWSVFEAAMADCGLGVMREPAVVGAAGDAAAPKEERQDGECAAATLDPAEHEPAVVYRATWEELGMEGNPQLVEMYVSEDGKAFEKVDHDLPGGTTVELFAAGDGFVALASAYPAQSVWYSEDGHSWVEMQGVPGADSLVAAGSLDGRIVVAGNRSGLGPVVAVYDDPGAAPEIIDVASLVGGFTREVYLPAAAVDEGAAALAVTEFDQRAGRDRVHLITTSDLETWSSTPVSDMIGDMQAQPGEVMISEGGIYAQILGYQVRPDAPWQPVPLMAVADRG